MLTLTKTAVPSIYVADLSAYASGHLHGVWIDLDEGIDADDVQAQIEDMLSKSPVDGAEEWEIHDTEGFAGYDYSHDLELLCQIAELIHQYGENAVAGFISHVGKSEVQHEIDNFSDLYMGCYESEVDFCQETMTGIDEAAESIPVFDWASLSSYIDWESIANDAFINTYYSHDVSYNEIHVYVRQ